MPTIPYIEKNFADKSLRVIDQANQICQAYVAQGYDLTLRQLYYQFVARDLIANKQSEYKRLGSIINDARLAGMLDWDYIVDRTRNLEELAHWKSPRHIVAQSAQQFRMNMWDTQEYRPEVWIEKDALVGVIEGVCDDRDVPYFSCRGYTSQSELWRAGQRLVQNLLSGKKPIIIHLGDHDPSGIDMTRDIFDRLHTFIMSDTRIWDYMAHHKDPYEGFEAKYGGDFPYSYEVRRIALNMDQITQYNPPPNPTKLTDSRAEGYIGIHGYDSWELDALDPPVMTQLIEDELATLIDVHAWNVRTNEILEHRAHLEQIADRWDEITEFMEEE